MRQVMRLGTAALFVIFLSVGSTDAQVFNPGRCNIVPADENNADFTPLPRGEIFCTLLADPKSVHSFVSALHGTSETFPSTIGAVGIGDSFGMFRWGPVQMNLTGSVFSQFNLEAESYDLINADYIVGIPLTFRREGFSARLRLYHQSSHLGDEFLLREEPERENLSFESIELILSHELGPFRMYGGGEHLFDPEPEDLALLIVHGGMELQPGPALLRVGSLGSLRFVAAGDVKSSEEQDWRPAVSLRAGFEVSRPVRVDTPVNRWQLLFEYYEGPTPYGQFFRDEMSYWGVGVHFTR